MEASGLVAEFMVKAHRLGHSEYNMLSFFSAAAEERFAEYRSVLKDRNPRWTQDMYKAMCTFLHLELQLLFKVKQLFECELQSDKSQGELNVIAQDKLDEHPLSKFNVILMEFFDAAMAHSEGYVELATKMTKLHYTQIEEWQHILRVFQQIEE